MRAFLDSNVAVYAFADDQDHRKSLAMDVLGRHGTDFELVLSTQVLLETYNVLVRRKGLEPKRALNYVRLLMNMEVIAPSGDSAWAAVTLAAEHQLPVYDAFIVQAALQGGCDTLFTEDLQTGRRFGPLVVVNPFDCAAHESTAVYAEETAKPAFDPSGTVPTSARRRSRRP